MMRVNRVIATCGAIVLAAGGIVLMAQGRGGRGGRAGGMPPVAFDAHDVSGYWDLPLDGRRVPAATLSPRVTKAMLDAEAKKSAKALRWCNWVGMPTTMDVGRPIDIRQGAREMVIVAESPVTPVRHCISIARRTSTRKLSIPRQAATRSRIGKATRSSSTRSGSNPSMASPRFLAADSGRRTRTWWNAIG